MREPLAVFPGHRNYFSVFRVKKKASADRPFHYFYTVFLIFAYFRKQFIIDIHIQKRRPLALFQITIPALQITDRTEFNGKDLYVLQRASAGYDLSIFIMIFI